MTSFSKLSGYKMNVRKLELMDKSVTNLGNSKTIQIAHMEH